MYESEKRGISWYGILRKLLILILIMILVFGFIYFINSRKSASKSEDVKVKETKTNKSSKNEESKQTKTKESTKKTSKKASTTKKQTNSLSVALTQFENGALRYFNSSNLPTEENKSKTVKLQNLINGGTLKPLESKDGKKCDKNKSTITITRLKTNYKLSSNLVCGEKSSKKTSYVGCYSNCLNNKICRGENSSENAVCKTTSTNNQNNSGSTTNNNKTNTNTNTNTSTNNSQNNSATTNNNTNSNTSQSQAPARTTKKYYKYKRCVYVPICTEGTLNANNECVVKRNKNYTDSYGRNYQSSINTYYAPVMQPSCETMWSDNPNLPGWEKTNITRYR